MRGKWSHSSARTKKAEGSLIEGRSSATAYRWKCVKMASPDVSVGTLEKYTLETDDKQPPTREPYPRILATLLIKKYRTIKNTAGFTIEVEAHKTTLTSRHVGKKEDVPHVVIEMLELTSLRLRDGLKLDITFLPYEESPFSPF